MSHEETFGPAATALAAAVDQNASMIQDLEDFRQAVYKTGLISFDDNNESDLPAYRAGVLLRLLDQVFSPYTETFFHQRPAAYETPTFTGGTGGHYNPNGTITHPRDLFDPDLTGAFDFDFEGTRYQRWDFASPAYIELAYRPVPTTDPDAPLEVDYRFDDGDWKPMEISSSDSTWSHIRGYGSFLELRGPGDPGPPHPRLRLVRRLVAGSVIVASYVSVILLAAPSAGLPPDWDVPPDDDDDEGDEEDEPEDPEPMAKRIRLADAAIKMEYYDKEE